MNTEDAVVLMLELAEQNAMQDYEVVDHDESADEFVRHQNALEVVQHHIDTDFGEVMGKYTHDQVGEALDVVYELGEDNILDELLTEHEEALTEERIRQLRARDIMHDYIVNHFGVD